MMRFRFGLATLFILCALSTSAQPEIADWSSQETVYGPSPTTAVIGQGGLAVGVNALGRVVSCRWPGPGAPDQLSARSVAGDLPDRGMLPGQGAYWGVMLGTEVRWLTESAWQPMGQAFLDKKGHVLETRCRLRGENQPDIRMTQRIYLPEDPNLLVMECTLYGLDRPPILYWFQNFTPCTQHLPELPLRDWLLDSQNDFAALMDTDSARCFQFRPAYLSSTQQEQAQALMDRQAAISEWDIFNAGVWVGTASPQPVLGFRCAQDTALPESFSQADTGVLDAQLAALGQCHALLALEPVWERDTTGDGYRARVAIAFGGSWSDTNARLTQGLQLDILPADADGAQVMATEALAIRVLRAALDQHYGVAVQAPITQPPLARCSARVGAWTTLALNRIGANAAAEKNLRFYLEALRREDAPGMPAGSLPATLYTDGQPATPHWVLDVTASAWLAAGIHRHSESLEAAAQAAFLEEQREALFLLGDFLTQWSQVDTGRPRPSFDAAALRDRSTPELALTMFMGLYAAIECCRLIDEPPPAWIRQLETLEALLRFHMLNEGVPWQVEATFPAWLDGMLEADHTLWQGKCRIAGEIMTLREAVGLELHQDFMRYPDTIAASYYLTRTDK